MTFLKIESSKRFLVKSKAYLEMPKRLHDEKSVEETALQLEFTLHEVISSI